MYRTTIGLEIHAELATLTKMFCSCKNDPDERRPNQNICPVCMGHPGTLPTINAQAVKNVLKVGIAVGGTLPDFTEFDRKNYFYPDIPKGYQLSQYKYPLVSGGELAGVKLTRIHLEEDTARSSHESEGGSLVDFNRAGVPLMELVTEPVISSAAEASRFARELQILLQYLGVAEANMEKGEMRVEANISVSKTETFGTKVEVKNLNSFKSAERAIEYEVARHIALLEKGETVTQETRGFDESTGTTFSQRKKEDSHDYRYFPDPDLPKLYLSQIPEFTREVLEKEIRETPAQKRIRYAQEFGLKEQDVEFYVYGHPVWDTYFEEAVVALVSKEKSAIQTLSNFIVSDIAGIAKNEDGGAEAVLLRVTPAHIAEVVGMFTGGELSSRGAKDVIAHIVKEENAGSARAIAEAHSLIQKNDSGAIEKIVEEIISLHPGPVAEFKAGKVASLQFLIGQGMKASKGSANPVMLKEIFTAKLS
ncbi:MAG TPA: Asp-tRNA(Asn)/Glu-tRNA(Gln) amidotransferase subunit GatB [Candidatus Paceibacterota bacterium]|nr:Asp-tRNA(Asn)/Glu-tRNA(Gln) amidotransferase subunit GatB [Candidatus Paceibacterota bacterium]